MNEWLGLHYCDCGGGNASNLNLRVFLFGVGWFGGPVHSASV